MKNKIIAIGILTMFLLALSTTFFSSAKIVQTRNSPAPLDDPDCDGRLWLWGPYGGWTGQMINFTPSILSLTGNKTGFGLGEYCVDFVYDFGDGTSINFTCCTMEEYQELKPQFVSHIYEHSGNYTAKITVSSPILALYDTDYVIIKDSNLNSPSNPSVKYKKVYNVEYYVHQYLIISNDLDDDPVRFYFEFDDGYVPWHPIQTDHGWTKFFYSGEEAKIWFSELDTGGKCRIKAQDVCGAESDWVVVKSKFKQQLFLPWFLQLMQKMSLIFKN